MQEKHEPEKLDTQKKIEQLTINLRSFSYDYVIEGGGINGQFHIILEELVDGYLFLKKLNQEIDKTGKNYIIEQQYHEDFIEQILHCDLALASDDSNKGKEEIFLKYLKNNKVDYYIKSINQNDEHPELKNPGKLHKNLIKEAIEWLNKTNLIEKIFLKKLHLSSNYEWQLIFVSDYADVDYKTFTLFAEKFNKLIKEIKNFDYYKTNEKNILKFCSNKEIEMVCFLVSYLNKNDIYVDHEKYEDWIPKYTKEDYFSNYLKNLSGFIYSQKELTNEIKNLSEYAVYCLIDKIKLDFTKTSYEELAEKNSIHPFIKQIKIEEIKEKYKNEVSFIKVFFHNNEKYTFEELEKNKEKTIFLLHLFDYMNDKECFQLKEDQNRKNVIQNILLKKDNQYKEENKTDKKMRF